MNRLTVISKNINKREINMVVVHSFTDAHKKALAAMERGCDEAVVEDEVHNVVLRLIKPKKTNFDRITKSPEALAEFIENILDACSGDIDECDVCQLGKHCNPCDGFRKIALNWLNEESKE